MIFIYRFLINIIFVLSPIIIIFRLIKRKEHPIRFKEKFLIRSAKRKKGKLIWFHGASVGEILSIIPLIEKLEKQINIDQILLTSSTLSSAKIFAKFNLRKTTHQFFPIDTNFYSKKFLEYWKPSLVIFVESEIWPNMLINLKKKSINHILLNARMSKKSYKKWKLLKFFSRKLFLSFNIIFPQNKETSKFLASLGAKNIKSIGNLKFSENEFNTKLNLNNNTKKFLKTKLHWCGSSTHNSEELICSNVHKNLNNKYKNLLTIIIPRHISRTYEIIKLIKRLGLKIHCHSWNKKIDKNTQIYLVDTYGETKLFFKESKLVFLGGSIIEHGGQNPLEAARYGCKIIHGPHIKNFNEIYSLLKKNKFSNLVNNEKQLTRTVDILLKKKINSKALVNKIQHLGNNILNSTLKEINLLINTK
jgi:3-deoxy-D-manno-octulosonic-acid transferase